MRHLVRHGGRAVPAGEGRRGEGQHRHRHGEGAPWGRPALGMEERADPFCVRSVLIKVTAARGRNGRRRLLFFHELKLPQMYFSGLHLFHNGKIAKPLWGMVKL